jgi:hypothetical protein
MGQFIRNINKTGSMKNLVFIVLAAFVLLDTACHPDNCCVPPGSTVYMRAQKDSVQWEADPSTSTIRNDTITIIGKTDKPGALQETLGIKIKYNGLGNYNLHNDEAFYYTTAGQSTPVVSHKLDSLFANSVNIFFYDPGSGTIVGSFNMKFISSPSSLKDIAFLQGSFEVPLHK